tara:strand:- start:87 stop:509 length:423 start_codon:yes stop_codon:yes gene_type:complete
MISTNVGDYLQGSNPSQDALVAANAEAIAQEARERADAYLKGREFKDTVNKMNYDFNQAIQGAVEEGRDQIGNIQNVSNLVKGGIGLAGLGFDNASSFNKDPISENAVSDAFTKGLDLDLNIDYDSPLMNTPGLSFNPFS